MGFPPSQVGSSWFLEACPPRYHACLVSHASPTGVISRKPCGRCGVFYTPTDSYTCTLCACHCQAFWPGKWFYPTPTPNKDSPLIPPPERSGSSGSMDNSKNNLWQPKNKTL